MSERPERAVVEVARLAQWFLAGYEPTVGELRAALVRAGLTDADELRAALGGAA